MSAVKASHGRAATLDEVLKAHPPRQDRPSSPKGRANLVVFLESL